MEELIHKKKIAIELTNACILSCAYCTRNVRHIQKPFFLSTDEFKKALRSLYNFKGVILLIGGEPTLHPQFEEICKLFEQEFPKYQRGLWSAGGKLFMKYQELIDKTFGAINFNTHQLDCHHQPNLIAPEEIVPDPNLRRQYIDNCWLQKNWSPSIGPNGVFFCEAAQSYDLLFDSKLGHTVEEDWWKQPLTSFQDQIDYFCQKCSLCLPINSKLDTTKVEQISPSNIKRLQNANSPYLRKKENFKPYTQLIESKEDEQDNISQNFYIEDRTTDLYFFKQYCGIDTRLTNEENQIKMKREKKIEIKRILNNKLSNAERFRKK